MEKLITKILSTKVFTYEDFQEWTQVDDVRFQFLRDYNEFISKDNFSVATSKMIRNKIVAIVNYKQVTPLRRIWTNLIRMQTNIIKSRIAHEMLPRIKNAVNITFIEQCIKECSAVSQDMADIFEVIPQLKNEESEVADYVLAMINNKKEQ